MDALKNQILSKLSLEDRKKLYYINGKEDLEIAYRYREKTNMRYQGYDEVDEMVPLL